MPTQGSIQDLVIFFPSRSTYLDFHLLSRPRLRWPTSLDSNGVCEGALLVLGEHWLLKNSILRCLFLDGFAGLHDLPVHYRQHVSRLILCGCSRIAGLLTQLTHGSEHDSISRIKYCLPRQGRRAQRLMVAFVSERSNRDWGCFWFCCGAGSSSGPLRGWKSSDEAYILHAAYQWKPDLLIWIETPMERETLFLLCYRNHSRKQQTRSSIPGV